MTDLDVAMEAAKGDEDGDEREAGIVEGEEGSSSGEESSGEESSAEEDSSSEDESDEEEGEKPAMYLEVSPEPWSLNPDRPSLRTPPLAHSYTQSHPLG